MTLSVYLLGFWSLEFYASDALRKDMQAQLGNQLYSTASFVAAEIEDNLRERIKGLEVIGGAISPAMMANPGQMQDFLDQRHLIQAHFNGGIFVMTKDGLAIADIPVVPGRTGTNYSDRRYAIGALRDGKATVGSPLFGRALKSMLVTIAVPIRDKTGAVIGALAGVTDLAKPNFLDSIGANSYGKAGGYLVISTASRMIVTATDKSRILEVLPPKGVNPDIDSFIDGREGHRVLVNPAGVETLVAVKQIPTAGWYLATTIPVAEAFAATNALENRIHGATLLLTVIAGLLMWWMLRRELAPLSRAERTLAALSHDPAGSTTLPVDRHDEIGGLISSFNRLLAILRNREAAIADSEAKYRRLVENSPDVVYIFSTKRGSLYFSAQAKEISGYTSDFLLDHPFLWRDSIHPDDAPNVQRAVGGLRDGQPFKVEYRLRNARGEWRWIYDRAIDSRQEGDDVIVEGLAMDITESKNATERIRHLAFFEQLTGLPNRRLLIEKLHEAVASKEHNPRYSALYYLDLDNFKTVNDTLGHDVGDGLLKQVATRIVHAAGSMAFVASLGADDFAILVNNVGDDKTGATDAAQALGQNLLESIRPNFEIGEYRCHTTASIGIVLFCSPAETSDDLLKRVDLAMYEAKASGRNTLRLFDDHMQQAVWLKAQLEDDLRNAIEREQFVLHYQAQFNADLTIIGAEALLRWHHPVRGLTTPDTFVDLAEQTGIILPIGRWVLHTACTQLKQWADNPALSRLTVAVNISALQLYQQDFVDQTLAVLNETGADPSRLKLEITESLLLEDIESAIGKMSQLRAHGVRFSLDDFGTGYSSLSYLNRLPLDQLKIDQSFVRDSATDPDARAITRSIISLGASLGLDVIAEGVETRDHLALLQEIGCKYFQGYFFSKPVPLAAFIRLTERNRQQAPHEQPPH